MSPRIPHVLDHSLPLHSGYTFRSANILRGQHRPGWEPYHLTSPKQHNATGLEPLLPHDIMYRRKTGFSIPLAEWFRGSLKEKLYAALTSPRMADTGLFDMAFLKRMADEHARGGTGLQRPALWSLYMFEAFLRHKGTR